MAEPQTKFESSPMLKEYFSIRAPFEEKEREAGKQVDTAKAAEIAATQKEKETLTGGEVEGQKRLVEGQTKAQEEYKTKLEKEPLPAFIPTQDSAQDLAGMFSLVSVLGMIVGRQDAQRALGAMNGMLEGYQKGRADLYKKERAVFEANFKSMIKKHEEFRKEMEDAVKLAATNKEQAMVDARQAALKYGGDIAKSQIDRLGPVRALETAKEAKKGIEHVYDMYQRQVEAERQRAATIEAAKIRARSGEEKLSPPEKKEKRGLENLSTEMERLRDTFKPEYANFVADTAGQLTAQFRARISDDPEMANWWRAYENVAMPERHSMFGAALTGGEQESWRRASIGPGNSDKEIKTWFSEKERMLDNKIENFNKTNRQRERTGVFEQASDPAGIL